MSEKLFFLKFICISTAVLFSITVDAGPLDDVFPDAREIYKSSDTGTVYSLALGQLKKINARFVAEREQVLEGNLTRRTYELPGRYDGDDARTLLDEAARRQDGRLLYSCEGLDCGSSNAWANERFGIKQLYGLDQSQAYRVWEVRRNNQLHIIATYTIQRGNRRVYAHVDSIAVDDPASSLLVSSPNAILTSLTDQGYYVFQGARFDGGVVEFDPEHAAPLVTMLRHNPFIKLDIVGHAYTGSSIQASQELSEGYAAALRELLTSEGIKDNRLRVWGVGSLAPQGREGPGRLVLIRQ